MKLKLSLFLKEGYQRTLSSKTLKDSTEKMWLQGAEPTVIEVRSLDSVLFCKISS